MKTVGKCSLLTVISIKDIRFAVENHPQTSRTFDLQSKTTLKVCNRSILSTNLPFSALFFLVYVNYYENCWELFTFNGYEHQGHSICSRKPPSMFVIGAFLRLKSINNSKNTYLILFLNKNLFKYRFGRIRFLCKDFAVFRPFFSCLCQFIIENCWEMFTFNGYTHQGHSICSRKLPSMFVIGAFFQLKSINNSKNTYLFENSTIHR
ncbi:hypothetical protein AGLY_016548 [Aphis glycines]|uniref:Uncharacterized protein n=1 Tax=Aphis glycines TaxID=307491 RepID=A0A6G0SY85_APHGL|nr:hypothetical protein AGLY_016548 [Aphis glycines]